MASQEVFCLECHTDKRVGDNNDVGSDDGFADGTGLILVPIRRDVSSREARRALREGEENPQILYLGLRWVLPKCIARHHHSILH